MQIYTYNKYIIYTCIYIYIYNVIMKTMYFPSFHHNGFVATHALRHYVPASARAAAKLLRR